MSVFTAIAKNFLAVEVLRKWSTLRSQKIVNNCPSSYEAYEFSEMGASRTVLVLGP